MLGTERQSASCPFGNNRILINIVLYLKIDLQVIILPHIKSQQNVAK